MVTLVFPHCLLFALGCRRKSGKTGNSPAQKNLGDVHSRVFPEQLLIVCPDWTPGHQQ